MGENLFVKGSCYVFLGGEMSGVGGAQNYIYSKSRWLTEHGFKVFVFCKEDDRCTYDFSHCRIESMVDLESHPRLLSKQRRRAVIDSILRWVEDSSEIVFESHTLCLAIWGEMLASKVNGRNFVYLLAEQFPSYTDRELDFLACKYNEGNLVSINKQILRNLLEHRVTDFREDYNELSAKAYPVLDDSGYDAEVAITGGGNNILLLSRLDKTFVVDATIRLCGYIRQHPEAQFNVCYIGDGSKKRVKQILKQYRSLSNATVQMLGEMLPLPRKLLESFNLAISKAGCARQCALSRVPTIMYALDKDVPIGFCGYEFHCKTTSEEASPQDFDSLVDRALVLHEPQGRKWKYYDEAARSNIDYEDHLRRIKLYPQSNNYYNVMDVSPSMSRLIPSIWVSVFKDLNYRALINIVKQFQHPAR